jgi:hypothetical protein
MISYLEMRKICFFVISGSLETEGMGDVIDSRRSSLECLFLFFSGGIGTWRDGL